MWSRFTQISGNTNQNATLLLRAHTPNEDINTYRWLWIL